MARMFLLLFSVLTLKQSSPEQYITRQGNVTFFSYTNVENIRATNNQVLSIFQPETGTVAVSILMRAFVFEKSLMQEHFNESYIESDLYPKATFEGSIIGFDKTLKEEQTRIVKGDITLRNVKKEHEIKVKITKTENGYHAQGKFSVSIKDHNIKVPALLSANIAETINIAFNFDFEPYEN